MLRSMGCNCVLPIRSAMVVAYTSTIIKWSKRDTMGLNFS